MAVDLPKIFIKGSNTILGIDPSAAHLAYVLANLDIDKKEITIDKKEKELMEKETQLEEKAKKRKSSSKTSSKKTLPGTISVPSLPLKVLSVSINKISK